MNQVKVLSPPVKSDGDKKDYRLIELQNGLKALLIHKYEENSSDESDNEIVAAANLTVGVGSFDEPVDIGGLAHFLEHMLFMGSEKYPEENGHNNFISANGGINNAMTDNEFTSFFFDVSEKAFPEALDRFAQQFASPLLLRGALQREREAVDSEYQMALSNDQVRIRSFVKMLIHDNHPASFFEYGNLKTLKDETTDDELYTAVREFLKKYVANEMFLSLQSKRTLDEMQELVIKNFTALKSGNAVSRISRDVDDIFKQQFFEKMYFIKPNQESKAMYMTWYIKSIDDHYKSRPLSYIKAIFENGGEGGIASSLRELGLALSVGLELDTEILETNSLFTLIKVNVELTDFGLENIDKVLEKVFSYLLMMKETSVEEHRRLYNEYKEQSEKDFKFHEEKEPLKNVLSSALGMKYFDDADILQGNSVYQEFDSKIISDIIDVMNRRRFNLIIVSDDHDRFDKKEKHFGTEFEEIEFPEVYQKLWDERKLNSDFFLEKPNPFRATNFEIFVNEDESPKLPVKIFKDGSFDVWHKLDNKFKIPHAHIKLDLILPKHLTSLRNSLMLKLFQKILKFSLAKKVFPASTAGLTLTTKSTLKGTELKFSGYNEKLPLLIDMVTKDLKTEIVESVFEMQKQEMKKNFGNSLLNNDVLCTDQLSSLLVNEHWTDYDFYKGIERVSFAGMRIFQQNFFHQMKVQVLMQGNITKNQAEQVVNDLVSNFSCGPLDMEYELKPQGYELPLGTNVLRLKSLMANDDNSYIKNFYQVGTESIRLVCLMRLLESILNPKAFEYLRTKEQLGYSVGVELESHAGVIGLSVFVSYQEHKHSRSEVYQKMETFMNEVAKEIIEELTDDEFESHQESRINLMSAEDLDLETEAARNWKEITEFNYVFNRFEMAAKVTKNLTKSDLQNFFKCFTDPEKLRKLSVQVIGNKVSDEDFIDPLKEDELEVQLMTDKLTSNEMLITNIDEFRRKLLLHPAVRSQIIFFQHP